MIIIDCIQGSDEWHALRIGNPGASSMDRIITSTGKPSEQRDKYLYQLAGEILIGQKADSYQTAAMARGIELEPEAREVFEFLHGPVRQVGLVYQDERRLWHASPDGLLDDSGLEIKCPSLPVHVEYLDKEKLPTEYRIQVQTSMMVTGFQSWWFMSYFPGLKPLILEVGRDEKLITILRYEVERFCFDLETLVNKIKEAA